MGTDWQKTNCAKMAVSVRCMEVIEQIKKYSPSLKSTMYIFHIENLNDDIYVYREWQLYDYI